MSLRHISQQLSKKDTDQIFRIISKKLNTSNEFFGVHAITLMKSHIHSLFKEDYYVCEKSDGIRILLTILPNGSVAVIDRTNNIFLLNLKFPYYGLCMFDSEITIQEIPIDDKNPKIVEKEDSEERDLEKRESEKRESEKRESEKRESEKHESLIKDKLKESDANGKSKCNKTAAYKTNTGDNKNEIESINDKNSGIKSPIINKNNKLIKTVIHVRIFDTLLFKGEPQIKKPLDLRLNCALLFVNKFYSNYKTVDFFNITVKQMTKSYGMSYALEVARRQNLINDGLIFTPVNYPYVMGKCDRFWKWKPPELNTVDFIIRINDFIELVLIHNEREVVIDRYLVTDFFMNGKYDYIEEYFRQSYNQGGDRIIANREFSTQNIKTDLEKCMNESIKTNDETIKDDEESIKTNDESIKTKGETIKDDEESIKNNDELIKTNDELIKNDDDSENKRVKRMKLDLEERSLGSSNKEYCLLMNPDLKDGSIGEFRYVKDMLKIDPDDFCFTKGRWVLYKIRTDKIKPNSFSVMKNILQSIDENIDLNYLFSLENKIREKWKEREENKKIKN
ncbi:mRNA-capping enzyme subunit alpha [Dictyocoela muelleri]|nr:mRNA-capping enzyme subunit alpha [Dictyocoela muelleri]